MRWRDRTLAVLAAAGTLLAGTLVSGSPAGASAGKPRCDAGGVIITNRDGGWGVMKGSFNLKRQPYQHCANVRRLHQGQVIYFHCWVRNHYGKWWAYGRVKGTNTYGWMSWDNFTKPVATKRPTCLPRNPNLR